MSSFGRSSRNLRRHQVVSLALAVFLSGDDVSELRIRDAVTGRFLSFRIPAFNRCDLLTSIRARLSMICAKGGHAIATDAYRHSEWLGVAFPPRAPIPPRSLTCRFRQRKICP